MSSLLKRWVGTTPEDMREGQFRRAARFAASVVVRHSPYYRAKFAEWGINPASLTSPDVWEKLPLTSKVDLLNTPQDPERTRSFILQPDPEKLAREPRVILRGLTKGRAAARAELEREFRPIFLTSTTGRSSEPVPFLYSRHDLDRLSANGRDLCEVMQCRPDWKILNLFPYAPHLGFWQVHQAMIDFGVFGLSSGGGKTLGTAGNLTLMARMNPDVVVAMPTFLYHLLSQALEEGLRFPKLAVLVLGGEKVPDGLRKRLAALAEAVGGTNVRVMATYGFTEAKLAWGECPGTPDTPTGYHIPPEYAYFEVIDSETDRVLPLGQPGELVVTPIDARGSVVLRYRTGDRVEGGLAYGECPHCGLNVPRITGRIARRSDVREMNIDKLKGTLIDFNALEHLLDSIDGLESYQVELAKRNDDPHDLDLLLIRAVARDGADREALSTRICSTFRDRMEITPNAVTFHTRVEMAAMQGVGAELKERRVVDRRPRG